MLAFVLSFIVGLSAFRSFHIWTTGFLVTDEYLYIDNAIHSAISPAVAGRFFFENFNILFFRLFGINSVTSFVYFLPVYLFLWNSITILSFYGIMKSLEFSSRTIALSLLSSLFLVGFVLLSLGFLTEPVGLSLIMLGIYFLVNFAKNKRTGLMALSSPFFAALAFGWAAYTREPYTIFILVGFFLVPIISVSRLRRFGRTSKGGKRWGYLLSPIILFCVTSGIFLNYPVHLYSDYVSPNAGGFITVVTHPVTTTNVSVTTLPTSTSSSFSAFNTTSTFTSTSNTTSTSTSTSATKTTTSSSATSSISRTTSTSSSVNASTSRTTSASSTATSSTSHTTSISSTSTSRTTSTSSSTSPSSATSSTSTKFNSSTSIPTSTNSTSVQNSSRSSTIVTKTALVISPQVENLVKIFIGGLVLGWGPILFGIGAIGFIAVLLRLFRVRDLPTGLIVTLSLVALFSYLVVSYFFSGDQTYFSLRNYSTILRFSDTAMPAYFLASPFAFSFLAKRMRYIYSMTVILLVFVVIAIPAYQTYATSAIQSTGFAIQNPLTLDYRVTGVKIRDFVVNNPNDGPFHIVGLPQVDWYWTPGNQLDSVKLYPDLSRNDFLKFRWTNFYVWGENVAYLEKHAPFIVPLIHSSTQNNNGTSAEPYRLIRTQVIFNDTSYYKNFFIRIQLAWNNT